MQHNSVFYFSYVTN